MNTMKESELIQKVIVRMVAGLLFMGLCLFIPAGTLKFWNGWLFLGALCIPMLFVMIWLFRNDRELLQKRIRTDEKEKVQKAYLFLSLIITLFTFVVPGLDYRYNWSEVPLWLVILSATIMEGSYFAFVMVMKQNSYASRVIEIQEGQRLIDTGLYAIVRHPMYLAATVMYGAIPLVLGSWYALIPIVFLPFLLAMRILNEEKVLRKSLPGYEEYIKKVKYRLIPFVW
jgi:protein-S-isoprenylcysteine O-methyltransferase Ste14